jgi:hypothetical protein
MWAHYQDAPFRVNNPDIIGADGQPLGFGPPTKTEDFFAGVHAGATFNTKEIVIFPFGEEQHLWPGQGLVFNIDDSLPKGTDREVTMFAVFEREDMGAFTEKASIFGYGKAETAESCCPTEDNVLVLWMVRNNAPEFQGPMQVQLGSDDGFVQSGIQYSTEKISVFAATMQSDDNVRYAFREDGGELITTGPQVPGFDFDNTAADLGTIGWQFDFNPRFMDGNIGMMAIVAGAMDDTKRDMIMNDLYERYVNGGNEPLIMAPGGVPGDYNDNGSVDAADYVLWRNGGPLENQVHDPGMVTVEDYNEWRARFGNPGAAAAATVTGAAPEPATLIFLLPAVCSMLLTRNRRR